MSSSFSNPVAPHTFNPIDGDNAYTNTQKLTNADFRSMLTPRPDLAIGDLSAHNPLGPAVKIKPWRKMKKDDEDEKKKKKKKPYSKEEDLNKGKYRDRAKERREGVNIDYDETANKTSEELSEEQTKYLGGDIEHTHLVKGLDFSLLQKARGQMQQLEEKKIRK